MRIYFAPAYNDTSVSFDTTRKASQIAQSLVERPVRGVQLVEPAALDEDDLRRAHHDNYIQAVRTGEPMSLADTNGIGWDERFFTAVCASNGGMVEATLHALATGERAGTLSSGLHHARAERGSGFCTFNGLAIAAMRARDAGAGRVVIVDLDAHCGGGTASIVRNCAGIEQYDVSVSSFDRYESSPTATLLMSNGDTYLEDIEVVLTSIARPDTIDVVIYNAGMDPHEQAGGVYGIGNDTLAARERMVFEWAAGHGVPVAWTLAGGYCGFGMPMDDLVDLHRLTVEAAAAA